MRLSETQTNLHLPVLLDPILDFFQNLPTGSNPINIFDGTFGGGGYSKAFLESGYQVIASDLDSSTIQRALLQDKEFSKIKFLHGNFADCIDQIDDQELSGCVLDLGFSSNQLDYGERGFSYLKLDEVLDLRYDSSIGLACWEKLYCVKTVDNLCRTLFTYSGEKLSKRISQFIFKNILELQKSRPILVGEFVEVVVAAIPGQFLRQKNSILSRVWQALRIWTNDELDSISRFLPKALPKLAVGGQLAIVSFHSLEDKIVTKFMRDVSKPIISDDFGNTFKKYNLLTPKAITASPEELENNVRSRSAMLRVLEKLE